MRTVCSVCVFVLVCAGVVSAQAPAKPTTLTITLTAEQVAGLEAYRAGVEKTKTNEYYESNPGSRPTTPVLAGEAPPAQTLESWLATVLAQRINQMVSAAYAQDSDVLAADVKKLTPQERKAIRLALDNLKKK